MNYPRYETDFYAWTQYQAEVLKSKNIEQLDWSHLAEEIEDMGRSEKRQMESRLEVLIMHLLKWQFQPNLRSRSWQLTLKEQRLRLEKLLQDNQSLKSNLEEAIEKNYPLAVVSAERETGLSSFPETCPYSISQILSLYFSPETYS